MTYNGLARRISGLASRLITTTRLVALALLVVFTAVAVQPAHAQSSDTWKSVAIIGGSTAAGAYIGHKIAGPTGTWIGAGIGATAGYAIDRRRRANESYNQYPYGDNTGYYDPNSGYYGNGPYNGGPYDSSAYPGSYPYQNNYSGNASRRSRSPRRAR